jgi:magnesium transporter
MSTFPKRYHPPGTAPGVLTSPADSLKQRIRIQLVDYSQQDFIEKDLLDLEECRGYLSRDSVTWIHVSGVADADTVQRLGEFFGLHPLALEDVLNTGQRPKSDSYDDQLFVVLYLAQQQKKRVSTQQLSMFLGPGFLVSFCGAESDPFETVRKRLHSHMAKFRDHKEDYLLYTLLDLTVDHGFPVLEALGEQVEILEDELLGTPDRATLAKLHALRRETLMLRRLLWPQREVVNNLVREDHPLIQESTKVYLRDCYDHAVQIIELLESYREVIAGLVDVYLSSVSNRLNEIMRVLTVIATLFIPLTFITSVYGMNFGNNSHSPWAMPELQWYYGYPALWALMIGAAAGLLWYFRRKRWL